MSELRDFVKKIEELTAPETVEIYGATYGKQDHNLVMVKPPVVEPIRGFGLNGLVDYLKYNVDCISRGDSIMIHVYDYDQVDIIATYDNHSKVRECYFMARPQTPNIKLNQFVDRERFNIMLQACFVETDIRNEVLSAIGSIVVDNNSGMEVADDGVTQSVEAKSGQVIKTKKTIPNPVALRPYRTFAELEQPESNFVLRINENMDVGLFEADGGAWKADAREKIKAYLTEQLKDLGIMIAIIV